MQLTGQVPLLQVFDMNEAARFYCDTLGFTVVGDSGIVDTMEGRFAHWMWLRQGKAELMLNTAYDDGLRPAQRDEGRWRGHGDVVLYFGCEDADAIYEALRPKVGALSPPASTPYGMRQLTLTDPDGYLLCFQAPVR